MELTLEFRPVKTYEQQVELARVASEIWNEYWPALIGQDQTDYMVENFQSLDAIQRDMNPELKEPYEYWLLYDGDCLVGYTGGHNESDTNRFFISKIYLYAQARGKHFASQVIAFYEELCRVRGFRAMYLTVNKYNELGVRAYTGKGFISIDSVETDIGSGFIMDDFIMEKSIS